MERTALIMVLMLSLVRARPETLRVSEEQRPPLDPRWDTEDRKLARIAESFRSSANLQRAVLEVLQGLTEEQLEVLERVLGPSQDVPQADMPEDLLEDSPQTLPGEESDGYRGQLFVVDNVNTSVSTALNVSEEQLYPQTQKLNREQVKELRIATIKNQIMKTLWPVGTPPSLSGNMTLPSRQNLLRVIAEKMKSHNTLVPEDVYTEKVQSFYPSCEIPRNTDGELWSGSDAMNLLFDLTYPSGLEGSQVNIVAAKLRLYKLCQSNVTVNSPSSEPEDIPSEEGLTRQQFSTSSSLTEDKMIRVSVYWYTRSLKKHRVKRKLLDSQMLSVEKESWTEWNIRGAVKSWRDNGRNFGLTVVVEDEDGNLLPTDKYFAPMNCSQGASTSRPIPGFLVARALTPDVGFNSTNQTLGQNLPFDTLLFPMIDLCTIELPENEKLESTLYHKANENSEPEGKKTSGRFVRKGQNTTAVSSALQYARGDSEKHKIRHYNHKHVDENHNNPPQRHLETVLRDDGDSIEEITWADDLDGHQLRKQIIVQKVIMKKQNGELDSER